MKYAIIALLCTFALNFNAKTQEVQITGFAYEDVNGDGRRDPAEPGVPGVMVSDREQVTVTDSEGRYSLSVQGDAIIFITKPADHRLPLDNDRLPLFYYIHKPAGSPELYYKGSSPTATLPPSVDFALHKCEIEDTFTAIAVADPQPETLQEIDFIRQDFVEEVVGKGACLGIVLGDIAFDHLDLWDYYRPLIGQAGIPFYHVLGNHDVNYDAAEDRYSDDTFERQFGPSYYSFDYGRVHFVALDSVRHYLKDGKAQYEGRLGERQLKWLKNDLALVPGDKLVVLLMHIPFYTHIGQNNKVRIVDRDALFEIVRDRDHLLALAGHTHTQEHHFLGPEVGWQGEKPLHQIVCLTLSGSWWSGQQDERGVPIATQRDGVPNGYQILEFSGNAYRNTLKASGKPETYQMCIHSPQGMIPEDKFSEMKVVVNVFDSSPRSRLFCQIDDGEIFSMENTPAKDPFAEQMFGESHAYNKPWVQALNTDHIWSAPLPKLEKGIHTITVKAVDQYGRTFTQSRVFYIW